MTRGSPKDNGMQRLRALLEQCDPREVFSSEQIAHALGISQPYAKKLLQQLAHEGAVECSYVYRRREA